METRKEKKLSEKPIVRVLLTVASILFVILGLVSLFKENPKYLTSIILIGLGIIYLWTEIQVIRNPNVLNEDETYMTNVQHIEDELALGWQRLVSFIVDLIICFVVSVAITTFLEVSSDKTNYILGAVIFVYYILTETTMDTTIGKAIFGLKVIDNKNWDKPEFSQILIRTLCRFVPFEALSFLSSKPKGWHDLFSNTVVIKKIK